MTRKKSDRTVGRPEPPDPRERTLNDRTRARIHEVLQAVGHHEASLAEVDEAIRLLKLSQQRGAKAVDEALNAHLDAALRLFEQRPRA